MDTLKSFWAGTIAIIRYLANLQWTHHPQPRDSCLFCNLPLNDKKKVVYDQDGVYAIHNRSCAGKKAHYLIFPAKHIRDIENLDARDLAILEAMERAKEHLLKEHRVPNNVGQDNRETKASYVHSGFHRGRRPFIGDIWWPDVVSIQHLHLHVIVEPRAWWVCTFKYPPWMGWMWRDDQTVLSHLRKLAIKMA